MTDKEIMQQALEALELLAKYESPLTRWQVRKRGGGRIVTIMPQQVAANAAAVLRERLAQPDHEGIVSEEMIQARMQEEIDELRKVIAELQTDAEAWRNFKAKTLLMRTKK